MTQLLLLLLPLLNPVARAMVVLLQLLAAAQVARAAAAGSGRLTQLWLMMTAEAAGQQQQQGQWPVGMLQQGQRSAGSPACSSSSSSRCTRSRSLVQSSRKSLRGSSNHRQQQPQPVSYAALALLLGLSAEEAEDLGATQTARLLLLQLVVRMGGLPPRLSLRVCAAPHAALAVQAVPVTALRLCHSTCRQLSQRHPLPLLLLLLLGPARVVCAHLQQVARL
jgi:hypothetical protein